MVGRIAVMSDPVGELEDLIERALSEGPAVQLTAPEVARLLAARIAPEVVLRAQLTHVGWVCDRGHDADDSLTQTSYCDECAAVFMVPPRTVQGTSEIVVQLAA